MVLFFFFFLKKTLTKVSVLEDWGKTQVVEHLPKTLGMNYFGYWQFFVLLWLQWA
jgi:hypothetical protein